MNETDYIVQKLVEMGWDDCGDGLGGDIFSPDAKFIADISYLPHLNWYEVRLALTGIFDRWANSGITRVFRNKGMVLDFFKSKAYMTTAYKEALQFIEDSLTDDPSAIGLMDKVIDMTVKWVNKES